jgi:hypothetical protein
LNEDNSITFAPSSTEGTTDVQGDYSYTLKSTFVPNENYLDGTGYSEFDIEPVELNVTVSITGPDVECNCLDVTWTDNDDQTTHFASRLGMNYGIPLASPFPDYSATLASQACETEAYDCLTELTVANVLLDDESDPADDAENLPGWIYVFENTNTFDLDPYVDTEIDTYSVKSIWHNSEGNLVAFGYNLVNITACEVESYTYDGDLDLFMVTYTIGEDGEETVYLDSWTQTPACGYEESHTVTLDGEAKDWVTINSETNEITIDTSHMDVVGEGD